MKRRPPTRRYRRPERRHRHRGSGLQRRRPPRPSRHQLAQAAPPRLPERTGGRQHALVQRRPLRYRARVRHEPRRLGVLMVRPRQRHEPRPGARERRHPRDRARKSAEPVQVFENLTGHDHPGGSLPRPTRSGSMRPPRQRPWSRRRRLRQRRQRRPRRQHDRWEADVAAKHGRERQLARGEARQVRSRCPRHRRSAGRTSSRAGDPCRQQLSLVRDPRAHFGLGRTAKLGEPIVRYPGGHETRLTGVGANQVLAVGR